MRPRSSVGAARGRLFRERPFFRDRRVEAVAPLKVVRVVAAPMEDAACDVTPESALAHDVDGLSLFDLADAFAELVDRDIHEPVDVSERVFAGSARVEKGNGAVARKKGEFRHSPLFDDPARDVVRDEARHIHGVFRGRVGGRVGEVEILEVVGSHPRANRGREDVQALVHPVVAEDLRPQKREALTVEDDLYRHRLTPRIVPRMA